MKIYVIEAWNEYESWIEPTAYYNKIDALKEAYSLTQASMDELTGDKTNFHVLEVDVV